MNVDAHFVSEPSIEHSPRTKDILRSQVRSHASRVSHRRTKASQAPRPQSHLGGFVHGAVVANTETRAPAFPRFVNRRCSPKKLSRPKLGTPRTISSPGGAYAAEEDKVTGECESLSASNDTGGELPNPRALRTAIQRHEIPTAGLDVPSAMNVGQSERRVLDYFVSVWMPSADRIPRGCHINGFTPLTTTDSLLSADIVSGAFQSTCQIHMYALLTISVARMQFVHRLPVNELCLREVYYGKALGLLRHHLIENRPIDQQLVMDVCFLALSEGCKPSPTRSDVYWQLLCRLIRICGGLQNLSEYVACLSIATDILIAAATMTMPALDFSRSPDLLRLRLTSKCDGHRKSAIAATIVNLNPRLRVLCQESITLGRIIKAINDMGEDTTSRVTGHVQKHSAFIYRHLTMSATYQVSRPKIAQSNQQAMTADGLLTHTRQLGFSIWLWFIAINATEDQETSAACVTEHISDMCTSLECSVTMFSNTNWGMKDTLVLWLAALGLLTSTVDEDQEVCTTLFVRVLRDADVTCEDELRDMLSLHLPLDLVDDRWMQKLWSVYQWAD